MAKKQIIPDKDFGRIVLTTRRTARNISMRPKADGLYVTTPPYVNIGPVLKAIEPYRKRLLASFSEITPQQFTPGYTLQSECFRLWLAPSPLKQFTVRSSEEGVCICYPEQADFSSARVQTLLRSAVERALKKKAQEYLPPLIHYWAQETGLSFRQLKISKARSRWGSCSSSRDISLSYYLMLLPAHLMDYVILHELAHTREMNHGPEFWRLLDSLTDHRAKALRKELQTYRPVF